ncbi:MBL fold metallo-hydrolase [Variovorax sp. HJSM1_2]|uniref:MBL fold metallo-hydrolase n=1 Tax=Variovorax sp. HJSM1_2 TaxID=3366263 RepID=UPI003BE90750
MLRFKNLGSGSTGNATVVEASDGLHTSRLLVDCGLGIRTIAQRLGQAGLAPQLLDGIFITHEHSDHIGCVQKLARSHRIPVWMSAGTHQGMAQADFDGLLHTVADNDVVALGALQFTPFAVPHDAREPLQLTCTDGANRLGILTDLGHADLNVMQHLTGCHALLLECNHDPALLSHSSYPAFLKRRISGPYGHLDNLAAASIAAAAAAAGARQIVAAHLSRQNNRPDLALQALAEAPGCAQLALSVADPQSGSDWFIV